MLRATFRTIAARSTLNRNITAQHCGCSFYDRHLRVIERGEVFHKGYVVLYLCKVRHTAQDHKYLWQTCGETDGPGCRRPIRMHACKHCADIGRQICESASFDRFHHDHRFAVLYCRFIA